MKRIFTVSQYIGGQPIIKGFYNIFFINNLITQLLNDDIDTST